MIQIDYQDKRPIYEQVVEKMKNLITMGILTPNDKVPSVRMMAIDLSINPGTIQKAYQELERLGYIYTVKGRGNFVSDASSWREDRARENFAQLRAAATNLRNMGIKREDIIQTIDDVMKERKDND